MHHRDGCARRQAPPRAKLRQGLGWHRGSRAVRRLVSTTMQEGDRASTSGAETGWTHPARCFFFIFHTIPENCEEQFDFWDGREGEPTGRELKRQHAFEGAMTELAKALSFPWTAAAGRHTETRAQRTHHHESSCRRFSFPGFLRRHYLLTTYATGFCSVAVLYTLHGERPSAILRDVVALCAVCTSQTVRGTW